MPFHGLPPDMAEAIMDHLPSVYHLYLCAQVCRAWRHHAHKVMEPRRRRMMNSDQTVDVWEAGNRPSPLLPYSNVVDHFAQHSFSYATLRAAYLPKFDFYVAGTGQKLDIVTPEACRPPFRGGVGLWMGTSSSVDAGIQKRTGPVKAAKSSAPESIAMLPVSVPLATAMQSRLAAAALRKVVD